MKKYYLLPLLLFWQTMIIAQSIEERLPAVQSPNVTAMDQYGKIPVSLFNGLPQINIPVGNLSCGDISIPLNLYYNASGNKPDIHPSWVGLGWNLDAAGAITRQINGEPDEENYLNSKSLLAASNWSDTTYIRSEHYDLSPDEFTISAPGLSATIFLNYDGKWLIRSKDTISLKVSYQLDSPYNTAMTSYWSYNVHSAITKFTITANNGFRYTFGGQPNAIEFNFPAKPSLADFMGNQDAAIDYYNSNVVFEKITATTWYLTSIQSPSGHQVKFIYDSLPTGTLIQGTYDSYIYFARGSNINDQKNPNYNSKSYIPTYYLKRIIGDDSLTCDFYKSATHDLPLIWKDNANSHNNFDAYYDPVGNFMPACTFVKLDSIKYNWGIQKMNSISFEYIDTSFTRLKLQFLQYKDKQSSLVKFYFFEYSPKYLPPYNANMTDHWGYYNGRSNFTSTNTIYSQAWANDYYRFKEADTAYSNAEILTRIIYPTGGYSRFYFEPHSYSTVLQQWPNYSCSTLTKNYYTGGLRIKKIVNFDGTKNTGQVEYFYSRNFLNNDTLSSGILAGYPTYYEAVTTTDGINVQLSSAPLAYLNTTNGNFVTYTQVTEKRPESGYIIHTFSNQDNGYMDKKAFTLYTPISYLPASLSQNKIFGKTDLERGLLLKRQYYDEQKNLLKEEIMQYNDDTMRFKQYARAIYKHPIQFGTISYQAAYPIYCFHPYLKSITTKEYRKGSVTPITGYSSFTYDTAYRQPTVTKTVNTFGDTIKITNTYPFNYTAIGKNVYDTMFKYNNLSKVVEKKTYNGSTLLKQDKTEYGLFNSNTLTAPLSVTSAFYSNTPDTQIVFNAYDSRTNLLEASVRIGVTSAFIYDYNQFYQVANVSNATASDISYTSFETPNNQGWVLIMGTISPIAGGITGKYCYSLDGSGSTALNRTGINSAKKYIVSFWYQGAEPVLSGVGLIQSNKQSVSQDNGWTYAQVLITGATDITINTPASQTGKIDELRLYPPGAEMITYTYLPGIGLSSICDETNRITYYEYDSFGRLMHVKDKDGNIIKKIEYKFLQ